MNKYSCWLVQGGLDDGKKIEERFHIGDKATYSKKITEKDVLTFADVTGDDNPVHT